MSDPTVLEGWVEWAIGMAFIALRMFARCRLVGTRWQGDDYLALLAAVCIICKMYRPELGLLSVDRRHVTPVSSSQH